MNEIVTYPSGEGGLQAIAGETEWVLGSLVEVINGIAGGIDEDRPYILKALTVESISIAGTYEVIFYEGGVGDEQQIFSKRFASTQFPFELPLYFPRTFLENRISVKLMSSAGSGVIFFSIQYEADPGAVVAS